MTKSKEPIRLRRRTTRTGLTSLYLDIYINGKRSYEYLRLYLVPEKTREDRQKNRETLQLAEDIRAKRMVELRNGEFGFRTSTASDLRVLDYFQELARSEDRQNPGHSIWQATYRQLCSYERNKTITFKDIDTAWVAGFREHLEQATFYGRRLAENTKAAYYTRLRIGIRRALEERIITEDPTVGVETFKREESKRMYLTIDEVRRLAQTDCPHESVKRAFLFSCLTGLRRSDIVKMRWSEVTEQNGYTRIVFRQQKTRRQEYLDITPQASELLGERQGENDLVFESIHNIDYTNRAIRRWTETAGISKHITFHCARHTFATMMLDLDTDIYTVSKLLGHTNVATTQIYTKVMDRKKQEAVSRIPDIIGPEDKGRRDD